MALSLLQLSTQDNLIYERLLALLAQINMQDASDSNDDKASWEAYSRITSFLLERIHKDGNAVMHGMEVSDPHRRLESCPIQCVAY